MTTSAMLTIHKLIFNIYSFHNIEPIFKASGASFCFIPLPSYWYNISHGTITATNNPNNIITNDIVSDHANHWHHYYRIYAETRVSIRKGGVE